jgi:hypothetical protein
LNYKWFVAYGQTKRVVKIWYERSSRDADGCPWSPVEYTDYKRRHSVAIAEWNLLRILDWVRNKGHTAVLTHTKVCNIYKRNVGQTAFETHTRKVWNVLERSTGQTAVPIHKKVCKHKKKLVSNCCTDIFKSLQHFKNEHGLTTKLIWKRLKYVLRNI